MAKKPRDEARSVCVYCKGPNTNRQGVCGECFRDFICNLTQGKRYERSKKKEKRNCDEEE